MSNHSQRSAEAVFQDHLQQSKRGSVEEDLQRNYSQEVVILTGRGLYRGYDGMRYLAELLMTEMPNVSFEYQTILVAGEMAFLEWTAQADPVKVEDGADSYLIREGRIIAQTIHYTVKPMF